MPWGAQTWVNIIPELGYGVYNGAGTPIYPTLYGGNSFTMRKVPIRQIIRTADGGNRRKFVVAGRKVYQGNLITLLHPDQAASWVTALTPLGQVLATGHATVGGGAVSGVTVDSPGNGYPIASPIPVSFIGVGTGAYGTVTSSGSGTITGSVTVTSGGSGYTSPPGVLIGGMPSYTIQFWDSVQAWRFLGCCITSARIVASPTQDFTTLQLSWVGQTRDTTFTTFAQPAQSNYSTLVPYQYIETAGQISLGGTPISNYRMANVTISNRLTPTWDELGYITSQIYSGRDLDFQVGPQYLGTTYRGNFEAQTPMTWVVKFNRTSPAHSMTITCETNTVFSDVADDLPLDGPGYQALSAQVFYDASNTADFTLAAT
jgi:hypothetical protein